MSLQITKAPSPFDGTLGELYDNWAKDVLLAPSVVEEFHEQYSDYMKSKDPLYLVRMVKGQERGQIQKLDNGSRLCPTDNAPAWWIHYQLFSGQYRQFNSFTEFIESVPTHMFQVRLPDNINKAGWHVAHIFNAKDGDVTFNQWDRKELVRRSTRNIHPCNYFYIPKSGWQKYGGDSTVIAYFYDKFKLIYRRIWDDFLNLAGEVPLVLPRIAGDYKYSYPTLQKPLNEQPRATYKQSGESHGCVAQYSYTRLCFKADIIEPLALDDKFCIVTPFGTFAMTKREFYEVFHNVLGSKSYQVGRIYHYSKLPEKALQFKVGFNEKD